jgi:hypothetical protein
LKKIEVAVEEAEAVGVVEQGILDDYQDQSIYTMGVSFYFHHRYRRLYDHLYGRLYVVRVYDLTIFLSFQYMILLL